MFTGVLVVNCLDPDDDECLRTRGDVGSQAAGQLQRRADGARARVARLGGDK